MLTKHYCFPGTTPETDAKDTRYTFIDIETTGLKRDTTILYLIGCGYYEKDSLCIVQWFNDDGVSEPAMLLALREFLTQHPAPLFTFNGESFDIPYLNRHYELNHMDYRLDLTGSLDLYRMLRPFQTLFHLSHGKQKDWERFLGISREDLYNGGQLIGIYKKYLLKRDPELLHLLLLHNMEDIRGMEALLPLAAYESLLGGQFTVEGFTVSGDSSSANMTADRLCSGNFADQPTFPRLTADCRLRKPLPKPLHAAADFTEKGFSLSDILSPGTENSSIPPLSSVDIDGQKMQITIPVVQGTLKYFYPDYKNYFYLPEEDRAIHKSVGCYVDSQFREKAKPATCYIRKNGLFLPLFPQTKYKGIQTAQKSYADSLTLYKNDYKDTCSFVELQPLFHGNGDRAENTGNGRHTSLANAYLCDYMKDVFISEMKKAAT